MVTITNVYAAKNTAVKYIKEKLFGISSLARDSMSVARTMSQDRLNHVILSPLSDTPS